MAQHNPLKACTLEGMYRFKPEESRAKIAKAKMLTLKWAASCHSCQHVCYVDVMAHTTMKRPSPPNSLQTDARVAVAPLLKQAG